MQVIFLSNTQLLLSFFIVWPVIQLLMTLICNNLSDKWFKESSFILKTRKWEKDGNFYKRVFKIHKWKPFLPDGAKLYKGGFQKKSVKNFESQYFLEFIAETGRAEITHWLQIIPFWVFAFWSPSFVIFPMFVYAMLVNFPCILTQRYNRPRLIRTYNHILKENERKKINISN
jgi:glycosyl-4,4'-diaponeurosporenoate acyltransferase